MGKFQRNTPSAWSVSDLSTFFVDNRAEFLSHARRVAASDSEAEEIVQDSLVRVLLACPELETEVHARSYFHRVIENLSIDLLRKKGRQPKLVLLDDAAVEVESKWRQDLDHSELLAAADDAALVREALSFLSPAERAALVMWELEGRSTSEIAKELGVKESAVKHTLSRARAGLRRILAERIIDEERGLTALDLLSTSFRKMEKVAQKSSNIALSMVLVLAAFLGFNSLVPSALISEEIVESVISPSTKEVDPSSKTVVAPNKEELPESGRKSGESLPLASQGKEKTSSDASAIRATSEYFLGLDENGVPGGFTVADSDGRLGELFMGPQRKTTDETGILVSSIVSTKSGAFNILLNQSILLDALGTSYLAEGSVGINGGWRPLVISYLSSDVERLASGNYLLTVMMKVDSALETVVQVPTGPSGFDLDSPPNYLATRVLLDPTKTKILAQAVLVSADSQGNGA